MWDKHSKEEYDNRLMGPNVTNVEANATIMEANATNMGAKKEKKNVSGSAFIPCPLS